MLSVEMHRGNREAIREGSYGRFLYNWFRYYDPGVGRYLTADPIGQLGGFNVFAYAWNNPIGAFDFFGLLSKWQCEILRKILEYEKKYGTVAAARHFSNTWGDEKMGPAFDNHPIETAVGTLDLDWFADIRSTGAGPLTAAPVYAAGKLTWNASKFWYGDPVLGNPKNMTLPYEDPKEVVTLNAIQAGFTSFASLFPPEFMERECGDECDESSE